MEANATPKPRQRTKVSIIPRTNLELSVVAQMVSDHWMQNQWLTLAWMDAPTFKTKLSQFQEVLRVRNQVRNSRPQLTGELLELERQMDYAVKVFRGYLLDTFGEKAKDYYSAFGITREKASYRFPSDKDKRSASLDEMVASIVLYGLSDKKYGADYWANMNDNYKAALQNAKFNDGAVSLKVGTKNVQLVEIRDVLVALTNVLKGHYPKTYKAEFRDWGFQKQRY